MPDRKVLHSWKDISNYTGRGVRTIQRYEVQLGFPIHRPAGKDRSAVLAFSDEIDAWLGKPPKRPNVHVLDIDRARQCLAIAAGAKRCKETAKETFASCVHQASRVREMMWRYEQLMQKIQRMRQPASLDSSGSSFPQRN